MSALLDCRTDLACIVPDAPVFHTGHATYRTASLHQMVRSKLNVRRKESGNIEELAALINSQGLLQNLVGYEQRIGEVFTGVVEIVAGGRRLAALALLIAAGQLPFDFQIPYLLVPVEEAIAISLAENMGREPMHPADVFDAMLELSLRGVAIEDIALAFGVDTVTVRRRLKLAKVSPRLVTLYRADQINFEQMAALAISDDHAQQEHAWDSLDTWSRQPHVIRRLLTAQQVDVRTDRVARFVGVKAFKQAGGMVACDLFTDHGAGLISDVALLENLAAQKLAKTAKGLDRGQLAWVEVRPRIDQSELATYGRVRSTRRAPTEEEQAELDTIDSERTDIETAIAALDEEGAEGELDELNRRDAALLQRREAITAALNTQLAADKALAGAIVTLDAEGKAVVLQGLIRPADTAKLPKLAASLGKDEAAKTKAAHSERLTRLLTAQRTLALQAELMHKPAVALVLLVHTLLGGRDAHRSGADGLLHLHVRQAELPEEARRGAAWDAVEARRNACLSRLQQDDEGAPLLDRLLALPQADLLDLLAVCAADGIDTMQYRDGPSQDFQRLAGVVGLDMRNWWQATADSYFSHVPKGRSIEVVTQAQSQQAAVPLEKLPRTAAAQAAERAVAGTGWLPELLTVAH